MTNYTLNREEEENVSLRSYSRLVQGHILNSDGPFESIEMVEKKSNLLKCAFSLLQLCGCPVMALGHLPFSKYGQDSPRMSPGIRSPLVPCFAWSSDTNQIPFKRVQDECHYTYSRLSYCRIKEGNV